MTRANPLRDLQEIDLRRDEIRSTLTKIDAALKSDGGVAAAEASVETADAALADIETELRSHTLEREAAKDHLAREEKQLYGGKVRVAKELQNLELEVESLRRQLEKLDDLMLELMLRRDEAAAASKGAHDTLGQTRTSAAANARALTERRDQLTDTLSQMDTGRNGLAARVPPADLHLYERLRKAKGGRAVADLADRNCTACGMQLPRQNVSRAQAGEQVLCAGCGRIVLG